MIKNNFLTKNCTYNYESYIQAVDKILIKVLLYTLCMRCMLYETLV